MPTVQQILLLVSVWALPLLLAITMHEAAHGFVAMRLGDDTAYRQGRVSINPLRHIDPFGTILLPALLLLVTVPFGRPFALGYAKPVPVAFGRLRDPRWGSMLVAAAGPGANILLAIAAGLLAHTLPYLPAGVAPWAAANLKNMIWINAILAVFNMIPVPPLDGGRILVALLPFRLARHLSRLEGKGILLIVGLLFLLPMLGNQIGLDLDILTPVIVAGASAVTSAVAFITGLPRVS